MLSRFHDFQFVFSFFTVFSLFTFFFPTLKTQNIQREVLIVKNVSSDGKFSLADCALGLLTSLLNVENPFNLCQAVDSNSYVAPFWIWRTSVLVAMSFLVTFDLVLCLPRRGPVVSLLVSRSRFARCQMRRSSLTHVFSLVLLLLVS